MDTYKETQINYSDKTTKKQKWKNNFTFVLKLLILCTSTCVYAHQNTPPSELLQTLRQKFHTVYLADKTPKHSTDLYSTNQSTQL